MATIRATGVNKAGKTGKTGKVSKVSAHCVPNQAVARSAGAPGNRRGSGATGLYPEVDRQKLARLLGIHKSTVTNILQGRTKPNLKAAMIIAREIRVDLEALDAALSLKRAEWRRERKRSTKR